MIKELFMSASRIKKLESCSFSYWKTYGPEPLPKDSNDGARIGGIVHSILEQLLNLKRKKLVNKIINKKSIYISSAIKRYTQIRADQENLEINQNNLDKINKYCLVALNNDFYCEGKTLESAEKEFRIENEKPYYKIMGYIDKQSSNGIQKIIDDYKSQKKLFEGEELTNNIQGLIYCLNAIKEDSKCEPEARFIFLQFPDDPIFIFKPTRSALTGLEYFLEYTYSRMKNFTEKDAYSDFAYDQGFPKEGFKGRLNCGFAKYKGQLKKDGSLMWHCSAKFPFDYYAVKDKDGKTKRSYFTKEEIKLAPDEKIMEMSFGGCPRFNSGFKTAQNEVELD